MGGITTEEAELLYTSNTLKPAEDYKPVRRLRGSSKKKAKADPDSITEEDYEDVKIWEEEVIVAGVLVEERTAWDRSGNRDDHTLVAIGLQVDPEGASVNRRRYVKFFGRLYWWTAALTDDEKHESNAWRRWFNTREAGDRITELMKAVGFTDRLDPRKKKLTNDDQIPADDLEGMRVIVKVEQGLKWDGSEDEDRVIGFRRVPA